MIQRQEQVFELQDSMYEYPYHYIPHFQGADLPNITRNLSWGLEYLTYVRHITDMVGREAPRTVLDVGCGDGRFLGMLPSQTQIRVGCDLSARAITLAKAMNDGIEFLPLDVREVPGEFDMVTSIQVMEHVPDEAIDGFVAGMAARLRVGGKLIVCVPSTRMKVSPKHYRHYDRKLLADHVLRGGHGLELLDIHELIKARDVPYRLFRFLYGRTYMIDLASVRRAVWKHMWANRVRQGDGLHLVGVFRRRA